MRVLNSYCEGDSYENSNKLIAVTKDLILRSFGFVTFWQGIRIFIHISLMLELNGWSQEPGKYGFGLSFMLKQILLGKDSGTDLTLKWW